MAKISYNINTPHFAFALTIYDKLINFKWDGPAPTDADFERFGDILIKESADYLKEHEGDNDFTESDRVTFSLLFKVAQVIGPFIFKEHTQLFYDYAEKRASEYVKERLETLLGGGTYPESNVNVEAAKKRFKETLSNLLKTSPNDLLPTKRTLN